MNIVKADLNNTYLGEYVEYNRLFLLGSSRTSSGNPTFTSSTSSVSYTVSDNGGENSMLGLLKTALENYMITAANYNAITNGTATYTSATPTSANTYSATPTLNLLAYNEGLTLRIKFNASNTGSSTLNIDSLGAKSIKKNTLAGKMSLQSGDIIENCLYSTVYDGTDFILITNNKDDKLSVGEIKYFATKTAPTGYFKANGAAVSRTTYSDLFEFLCPPQTFTVTIASPAVFTATGHGFAAGDPIRLTTTGALPTGLGTSTTYYVISAGLTSDAFQVSTSVGGSAVNTTGSQSGTHTLRPFYHGVGDGSTTFNLPDLRGVVPRGWDDGRGYDSGRVFGSYQADDNKSHDHTASSNTTGSHSHTVIQSNGNNSGGQAMWAYSANYSTNTPGSNNVPTTTDGSHSHTITVNSTGATEVKVKNVALLACIKY